MTSPSSLGREIECMASVVLPHSKSTGPRAVRGRSLHAFMCRVVALGREEALALVEEDWRPAADAIDFSRLPPLSPETGVPELAMAWNVATGEVRELGRNGDVEHDDLEALLRPGEMGGIIDWCSLTPDAVFICDFKFGYQALERAEANNQIMTYACMASKLFGRSQAVVSIARIFDNGSVFWDVAPMDELRLDGVEAKVRLHLKNAYAAQLAFRNTGLIPTPHEGGWCRYCPAQNACPAKVALLLSLVAGDEGKAATLAMLPEPLTPEVVSRLWPKLKQAQQLIERLQDNLRDHARVYGAVKLPNGNLLAETESDKTSIDPTFARPVLEARFGPEGANMAIKTKETLTWSSLDDLLKCHSSHGKQAKLKREVVAELDAAGAIRTVQIHNVTEVSAKSKRLKPAEEKPHLAAENPEPEAA